MNSLAILNNQYEYHIYKNWLNRSGISCEFGDRLVYTFINLPKLINGTLIVYSVTEDKVVGYLDGVVVPVQGATNEFTVTNSLEVVSIKVKIKHIAEFPYTYELLFEYTDIANIGKFFLTLVDFYTLNGYSHYQKFIIQIANMSEYLLIKDELKKRYINICNKLLNELENKSIEDSQGYIIRLIQCIQEFYNDKITMSLKAEEKLYQLIYFSPLWNDISIITDICKYMPLKQYKDIFDQQLIKLESIKLFEDR